VWHLFFYRRPALAGLVITFFAWLLAVVAARLNLLDSTELLVYDWFVTHRNLGPPSETLVFVDFDNDTIRALGTYPVPRGVLAKSVARITEGYPELIGLDWILSEPRNEAEDRQLADAIDHAGNLILTDAFASYQLLGNEPLPVFQAGALDVAFANFPVDGDGIVRRMLLGVERSGRDAKAGQVWLSMPASLMMYHQGKPPTPPKAGGPAIWHFDNTEVPLDGTQWKSALIGYWSQSALATFSAKQVLEANFDPTVFNGKIVLVGQSNSEAKDLYATPGFRFQSSTRRPLTCGAAIHAAALATLLTGKSIRVLDDRSLWVLNLLFVGVVIALILGLKPAYSIPAALLSAGGVLLLAWLLFLKQGLWLKVVSSEAGICLAIPAGLGYRLIQQRRERWEAMGLLEHYLSPQVADEVWRRHQEGENVLRGQQRTVTVLFSDIRDFTKTTAGKAPEDVLQWLNHYLAAMDVIIRSNGGMLNKFIGDGIMVLFGAPENVEAKDGACRAVRTALQMIERVKELNSDARSNNLPLSAEIRIGVGIHTGLVSAGNVGSGERLEYTVIGETVNLASRLEAQTKEFKTPLVFSPQTWELVRDCFKTAPLGEAEVRGFSGKIRLFTVHEIASEAQQ
jgi:class 3 adenylate cyclase/CHASE2 domain-containing sensor protein